MMWKIFLLGVIGAVSAHFAAKYFIRLASKTAAENLHGEMWAVMIVMQYGFLFVGGVLLDA